ncbi:MAG: hypothetical protein RIS06_1163 [Actinomycetota bacterium]
MSDTAAIRALRTMDLIPYILEHPGISIKLLSKRNRKRSSISLHVWITWLYTL